MSNHELLRTEGIPILEPEAPLEADDFARLAQEIDRHIEANGKLHAVMIDVESFPGSRDFAALIGHLRFVKNHHQKILKVAVVSDSSLRSFVAGIVSNFVQAAPSDGRVFAHGLRCGCTACRAREPGSVASSLSRLASPT